MSQPDASAPPPRPVDAPQPSRHPAPLPSGGWREVLHEIFGLDLRSLGLMRILLGAMLLLDTAVRSTDISNFYSDQGAFPRTAVLEMGWSQWRWSLHMGTGEPKLIGVLFAIQAVFAVMFMVGYRTRLATIASWVFVVSLHARASLVLQAGDILIRLILFWSMFLPLAARFSVDALRGAEPPRPPRLAVSLATVGLMVQMAYMYVFTAIMKSGGVWQNGMAVYYALSIDHYVKQPQTSWVLQLPNFMKFLTGSTMVLEYAGPVALFSPFLRGPIRTLVCASFIGLHIGFFTFMEIGFFPWICMIAWVGILPGWLWDKLSDWQIVRHGPPLRVPLPVNAFLALCLVIVTWWNMSTIHKQVGRSMAVPEQIRWIGNVLRLDQKWDMFAPYPMKDDGWYVLPGRLSNGQSVELWRKEPTRWVPVDTSDGHVPILNELDESLELERFKPAEASSEFKSQRWRKYMRNLWVKTNKNWRLYFGKHVCREWNATHKGGESLRSFRMVYMKEYTPKPGGKTKIEPVLIWKHDCFKSNEQVKSNNQDKPAEAAPAGGLGARPAGAALPAGVNAPAVGTALLPPPPPTLAGGEEEADAAAEPPAPIDP